jgi:hypothetical protein
LLRTIVRIGDREITEGIIGWSATPENDPNRHGVLSVAEGALTSGVDYAADVRVLDAVKTPPEPLFTGLIWSVTVRDDNGLDLELRTGSQRLREQRIGGLILGANMSVPERIYSVLRLAGVKPEQMMLQGLAFPLPNAFEVSTPVSGLLVSSAFAVGDVTFVSDGQVPRAADDLAETPAAKTTMTGGGSLIEGYRSASCWAWTTVQAASLDAAEELGLSNIRRALAWISLCARYSFSASPGQLERRYHREIAALSRLELGSVAHVRALRSPHRWLRCVDGFSEHHDLDPTALDLQQLRVPRRVEGDLWQAVLSWRRASESSDFLSRSSALWQGVEHYVKATATRKLFSRADLDRLRKSAPSWMGSEQTERFTTMIDHLNDVPLMPRLHAAIGRDQVPISDEELEILKRSRELRNRTEHGQVPSEADADDLRLAIGILGRLLVYRLANSS